MRPFALFMADLHVRNNDRIWTDPEHRDLTGDTAFALEQIIAIVKQSPPKNVFLGGDNLEAKLQKSDAIGMMRHFLEELLHSSFVYYVQGQHELSDPPLLSSICPRVVHLHKRSVMFDNGKTMYGLDYTPVTQVAGALAAMPACDILLTHQVWKEFLGEERGEVSMKAIPSCKLLLTGDFHQQRYLQLECRTGPMQVLSPGPACMQEITEAGPKFVYLLADDLTVTPVQLKTRPAMEVRIDTMEDLEHQIQHAAAVVQRVSEGLPESVRKPILRVIYPVDAPQIYARAKAELSQHYHLFFKPLEVVDTTITNVDVQERLAAVDGGLAGVVTTYFNDDPVAASIALRLAESNNVQEEISVIYNEFVKEVA